MWKFNGTYFLCCSISQLLNFGCYRLVKDCVTPVPDKRLGSSLCDVLNLLKIWHQKCFKERSTLGVLVQWRWSFCCGRCHHRVLCHKWRGHGMIRTVWCVRGLGERKGMAWKQLVKERGDSSAWQALQLPPVPPLGSPQASGSLLSQGLCYWSWILQQHFETGNWIGRCDTETNKQLVQGTLWLFIRN